jgi:hypothetical protein
MTRRAAALAVVLVALAGAAALVVAGLVSGSDAEVAPPSGDPVSLESSVAPQRALFGDRLDATLTVTIDSTRVDPETVEVAAFFRPFRRVGPIETTRTELGETVVLEYRYPIQCIDRGCLPEDAPHAIALPVGVVRYAPRTGPIGSLPLTWPEVSLLSRLSPEQLGILRASPQAIVLDGEADNPPPVSYAIGPSALGWLLVGAGVLVVLCVAGWLAWRLRGSRQKAAAPETAAVERHPLDAAVAAVDEALLGGDVSARRAALDALALELGRQGHDGPAREARRVAWSRAVPDEAGTRELLEGLRNLSRDAA